MSRRRKLTVVEIKADEACGARIMADLACACGSRDLIAIAPGHEGFRVNLLGESAEGPSRSFALTPDRAARGWCASCWPCSQRQPIEIMECAHAAG